ncbi:MULTISPECIES: hypothetical protein [Ruminococcus]|uniref:Uncharacterized protein n=1 Tax=Ruminococcus bicirculans (ex Wegman et al. 2014) TaxID=1160721 RepID=A0AAW6DUD4_9FIRM|nr:MULTISPECIES: hypothetical protein [Ruminococcus]MDB8734643.1 hypothetical protein [Ruminococcus bicirculans (ex Wegman et al. 2014)]MDB8741123.1 hypothetical protein [Ruminococcus bicirculans (ex Wegman et al. 2014)]MEE0500906.1 hypothetical protein [Ruminococcus sp.]MEE1553965.1 hypothetical protein [Lachnospiraceae bacterium]
MIYNHFQPAPVPRARGDDTFTAIFDADTVRKDKTADCSLTPGSSKS